MARDKKRQQENQQRQRDRNFWRYIQLQLDNPCVDCGETDIRVLQFDHLPDFEKSYTIGESITASTRSWSEILKEVAKCESVCANCHAKRTAARANQRKHQIVMGTLVMPEDLYDKVTHHIVPHGGGVRGRRGCKCELCRAQNAHYSTRLRNEKKAKEALAVQD